MTDPQTVSVVVPVYNRAAYLVEMLDSVLAQSRPAAEVIVVDDGSTDDTPEVLADYAHRLQSVRIENGGPGIARLTGVARSTGHWIAFCDSDDVWKPDHLARKFALLERFPDADFLFSNFANFGPQARADFTIFEAAPANWWANFEGQFDAQGFLRLGTEKVVPFIRFNPAWPTTIMLTRDLYERSGGINPAFSRLPPEDGELTRRCVLHGNVACDREVTALLRRHDDNVSGSKLKNWVCKYLMLEHALARATLGEGAQAPIHTEMGRLAFQVFHEAFSTRDYRLASRFAARVPPQLRGRRRYLSKRLAASVARLLGLGEPVGYPEL